MPLQYLLANQLYTFQYSVLKRTILHHHLVYQLMFLHPRSIQSVTQPTVHVTFATVMESLMHTKFVPSITLGYPQSQRLKIVTGIHFPHLFYL